MVEELEGLEENAKEVTVLEVAINKERLGRMLEKMWNRRLRSNFQVIS